MYRQHLRTGSQDLCQSHQLGLESSTTNRIHRTPLKVDQDALDDDRALRIGAGQKYGKLKESFTNRCPSFTMMSFRFWLPTLGSSSGTLRPLTSISAGTRIVPLASSSFIQVWGLSPVSSRHVNFFSNSNSYSNATFQEKSFPSTIIPVCTGFSSASSATSTSHLTPRSATIRTSLYLALWQITEVHFLLIFRAPAGVLYLYKRYIAALKPICKLYRSLMCYIVLYVL